jgi:hypothetical protein
MVPEGLTRFSLAGLSTAEKIFTLSVLSVSAVKQVW